MPFSLYRSPQLYRANNPRECVCVRLVWPRPPSGASAICIIIEASFRCLGLLAPGWKDYDCSPRGRGKSRGWVCYLHYNLLGCIQMIRCFIYSTIINIIFGMFYASWPQYNRFVFGPTRTNRSHLRARLCHLPLTCILQMPRVLLSYSRPI